MANFIPTLQRSLLSVAAAAALTGLTACGGGADAPSDGTMQFASQMRASALAAVPEGRAVALATTGPVTADMVLDWAEFKFASLFPKFSVQKFPAVVYQGVTYNARAYTGPWGTRYLGITPDGRIFGMGDFTNNLLQAFDTVAFWGAQVQADRCAVNPASCTATPPAGPLNDCTLPAAQALATGSRFLATYAVSGSITGQITFDSLVQGPGTFEGQSATRIFSKTETTFSESGITLTNSTEATSYAQDGGNGFTRSLGTDGKTVTGAFTIPGAGTVGGQTSLFKTVFTPPELNVEFSIQPGQAISKNSVVTSTVAGITTPALAFTTTHTFAARESITVRGRSYNTCRYTSTEGTPASTTTHWYIVNRGVAARTQTVTTANGQQTTDLIELVQGSLNGAPL